MPAYGAGERPAVVFGAKMTTPPELHASLHEDMEAACFLVCPGT